MLFVLLSNPKDTHAGVFSFVNKLMGGSEASASSVSSSGPNSQTMALLQAATNINPTSASTNLTIVDGSTIESSQGPSGTAKEVADKVNADSISTYTVHNGDTLASIAKMFGVSSNTILWANNLKSSKDIHVGDELVILPISGLQYTVKKGDTLKSIAKATGGDVEEILSFNDLSDDYAPKAGDQIIIPDGEIDSNNSTDKTNSNQNKNTNNSSKFGNLAGYFIKPTSGVKTQGLHGKYKTAIDIGTSVGTPVRASASGRVIIAKTGGYNGGYGNYIVIQHPNGIQTLYGHLSEVDISAGSSVSQGDMIGKTGNTGHSTGPHLHFELWGGIRNWNPFN